MIGQRLGPYEITAKLGEGGMGEVYRATDTKLDRQVAIKVLPAAFTEDPERLARFEREAKLLAQLHHSNIASIFGLEESDGVRALVMELVDGPTLAERLEAGSLPLEESLSIARQIAEALEEAHEKGIIHRDLKPQNIKASVEGKVKVLDFGLAKAMDPAGTASGSTSQLAASPTLTLGATQMGVILGTAAYMSPEQAKGMAVDKRADIWAFGVVLYEMLTGVRLFEAPTVPETLAQVLTRTPDLDSLPASTPSAIRRLLRRCLERNPKQRLHDIADARLVIEDAIAGGAVEPARATVAGGRRGRSLPWVAALLAGVTAISVLLVWSSMRVSLPGGEAAPEVTEFAIEVENPAHLQLSPDGRRLLWIAGRRGDPGRSLWMRSLDSRRARLIVSDADLGLAFWSPDGSALAVGIGGKLWRYPASGGEPMLLCDFPKVEGVPRPFAISGAWLDDDSIFFGLWRGGAYRVAARGGVPEVAVPFDPEADVDFHQMFVLPDGKSLLVEVHRQRGSESEDAMASSRLELFRDGRRSPLAGGEALADVDPVGFAGGTLMLVARGEGAQSVWGVPFDAGRGTVGAKRFVVVAAAAADFSAADGTLAYIPRQPVAGVVTRIDRTGTEVGRLGESRLDLGEVALSPDGSRLAVTLASDELWVEDLVRGTLTRLVEEDGRIYGIQWTSDSRTLYYTVAGKARSLRRVRADPGAAPETVVDAVDSTSIAPDGSGILLQKASYSLKVGQGLHWVALGAAGPVGETREVVAGIGSFGHLAPDGGMLAYRRIVGQRFEAFLTTFPTLQQTLQLSSNGGDAPIWSPDGRSVFYNSGTELIQVEVGLDARGVLTASPERRLFDAARKGLRPDNWSVAPDGNGFLFVKALESERPSEIVVVRNGLQRAIAESR